MSEQNNKKIIFNNWFTNILTEIGFFAVGVYFVCVLKDNEVYIVKSISKVIPCVILSIWVINKRYRDPLVVLVSIALIFNAAGDLFLEVETDFYFILGVAANLSGHIFYIIAFSLEIKKLKIFRLIIPFIYLIILLVFLIPQTKGAIRIAVTIYSLIIIIMAWRAAATIGKTGRTLSAEVLRLSGAILFIICDTLIAVNTFILPIKYISYPIMISYWGGQWMLAYSTILLYSFRSRQVLKK